MIGAKLDARCLDVDACVTPAILTQGMNQSLPFTYARSAGPQNGPQGCVLYVQLPHVQCLGREVEMVSN